MLPACKAPPSQLRAGDPRCDVWLPPTRWAKDEDSPSPCRSTPELYPAHPGFERHFAVVKRGKRCCSPPASFLACNDTRGSRGYGNALSCDRCNRDSICHHLATFQNLLTPSANSTQAIRAAPQEGKEATDRAHHRCEAAAEFSPLCAASLLELVLASVVQGPVWTHPMLSTVNMIFP